MKVPVEDKRIHFVRRGSINVLGVAGACWRLWPILFAASLLLLPTAPLPCESVVVIGLPSPPLRVKQKPRITVLFDDEPLAGALVRVGQVPQAGNPLALSTDAKGQVVLPELSPGRYAINVSAPSGSAFGASVEVCFVPCLDDGLETFNADVVQERIDAPAHVIVTEPTALSELWMEVGPTRHPDWPQFIAAVEQEPIKNRLPELAGVVQDRSGAFIPGASVYVVAKGTQGKKHVALLSTDAAGRFSARLPDGDYVAIIYFSGFRTSAVSFRIAADGNTGELNIYLDVGSVT